MKKKILTTILIGFGLFFCISQVFAIELTKNNYILYEDIENLSCLAHLENGVILYNINTGDWVEVYGFCGIGEIYYPWESDDCNWDPPHTDSLLQSDNNCFLNLGNYSMIETLDYYTNGQPCGNLDLNYQECKANEFFADEFLFNVLSEPETFIPISSGFVSSALAYINYTISGLGSLLYFVIGAPVAFWVLRKVIGLVPKR